MKNNIKKYIKNNIINFIGLVHKILGTKQIIIFKGYDDLDGNSYVLYKYLLKSNKKDKYKFVWLVSDYKKFHADSSTDYISRTTPILKNIYYRACGKFLFWDHGYVDGFDYVKKVVYLGHGNPAIKNTSSMIYINKTPTDIALTTSEDSRQHTAEMLNFPQNKLFVCGLPRNDVIFNEKSNWTNLMNCKKCKVILWMPTFRKAKDGVRNDSNQQYLYGLPLIHTLSDLDNLNIQLKCFNLMLVIKLHPYAEEVEIKNNILSNIIFLTNNFIKENDINIYSYFADTAALLTDYSSVAFDFMLVDKPIGYIIDDIDDYKLGFAFKNILEYMPGDHITNMSELYSFFKEVANNNDLYKAERRKISQWANKYSDGNNCERITKLFSI